MSTKCFIYRYNEDIKIDYEYKADAHFPDLDKEGWKITESSDERTYFDLIYEFVKYERK